MMSKHTSGTWTKRKIMGVGLPGQVGYAIDYNEDQEQVVDYVYEEADADLICAAPDLLEALELYMAAGHGNSTHFGDQAGAYSKAVAAIAKAKGETK
jgi:hypothetical protein